jgi:NAD(P) transhydrogenase
MRQYDLAVIGTGPAGQRAAIQGAKLGKRVVAIEESDVVGGAQINTGTIPSKALREAAMHLTGRGKRGLFGESYRVKRDITVSDLISVSRQVIHNELDVVRDAFDRNGIDLLWGHAEFIEPQLLQVSRTGESDRITAERFIIAVGTRPARPTSVPFDVQNVFSTDDILSLRCLPRNLIVVGGGVIGSEYACIMATLGVRVTLIEARDRVLPFLDQEIIEAFHYHMRRAGITLRLGEKVASIEVLPPQNGTGTLVQATLESGKTIRAQTLLYAVGRQGVCKRLALDRAGLRCDDGSA